MKRKDFPDSKIMDALDACDFSIPRAAKRLGVNTGTLARWIQDSDNLRRYRNDKLELDALNARDKLNGILNDLDYHNPRFTGNIIAVCKILLDKSEADKQEMQMKQTMEIDQDLQDKINKLMGM